MRELLKRALYKHAFMLKRGLLRLYKRALYKRAFLLMRGLLNFGCPDTHCGADARGERS